ncbi:Thioredoxin C-2 [Frondihabitans sp. 762G35]|uniref:TlpA family protein disulfide reductase n=1 Tax=Frondihabitans sp. 762G35 TaxID=1446794 RepID=UPI000D1FFB0C|nr:thioredoxin family protein [Frondihabitans sp. 762G35]ARC57042.1 Thioredoxin C-2 [Frondihabitans sp. 762G35]
MDPVLALLLLGALVAAATVVGLVWRRTTGRVGRRTLDDTPGTVIRPADVGVDGGFGERGTLLQFSTEFCTFCPATRRLLSGLAERNDGVVHVDVDLTHAPDLAKRYDVLQTPTTLLLDDRGIVRGRIGGPPRPRDLETELARLLGEDRVDA